MVAAAILNFQKFEFLTVAVVDRDTCVIVPKLAAIDNTVTEMAVVRHLSFQKFRKIYWLSHSESRVASPCQISSKSVMPLAVYRGFSISKMAAVRRLEFKKSGNFIDQWDAGGRGASSHHHYRDIAVFDIQYGGCPPSCILKKFKI